jgi:hypothetical protein
MFAIDLLEFRTSSDAGRFRQRMSAVHFSSTSSPFSQQPRENRHPPHRAKLSAFVFIILQTALAATIAFS